MFQREVTVPDLHHQKHFQRVATRRNGKRHGAWSTPKEIRNTDLMLMQGSVCVSLLVFPPTLHAAAPLQIPLLPQLHTTHNIHPAQFVVLRFN